MYEPFYGFHERPFSLLPDPDFLFLSKSHQTALDLLELAVFNYSGFCVISGEIGAGKTTLIRELLNRLDKRIRVGLVSNTHSSFGELLQWVLAAYGLPCVGQDKPGLLQQFIDFVIQQYAENRHTLLVIDEAQNLSAAALEELRMLSNVNTDKDFVLQIILVGQQQLRDKLRQPQLEQFAQRIALDHHVQSLSQAETGDYIAHRLQHAGAQTDIFSSYAMRRIYEHTGGIPRLINRLCDLCLVYGYSEESSMIDADLVNRVAVDRQRGALSCGRCADEASERSFSGVLPDSIYQPKAELKVSTESPSPATDTIDLHRLIVQTERQPAIGGKRGVVLWVLLGAMLVSGGTGWATRDLWLQQIRLTVQQVAIRAQALASEAWANGFAPAKLAEPGEMRPAVPLESRSRKSEDASDKAAGNATNAENPDTKNGS